MPRDTPLKKTLFACDELSGFVHACGLVRPTGLDGLEPKSVKKKLKQPSFAAGVHRDEVYAGAELLGLELDEHIANVVAALQPIAARARPARRPRTRPSRLDEPATSRARSSSLVHQPHRGADEARARELADDDVRPRRGARRAPSGPRRGTRRASRRRARPRRRREQLAAAARRARRRARSATRARRRAPRAARPARSRESQFGSKRAAPSRGSNAAVRLVRGLREVARPRDPQPLGVGDDERAGRVGPAEPLLPGDGVEVEPAASTGIAPTDCAPSTRTGTPRLLAQLAHRQRRARSSRARARRRAAACAASPRRGSRPRPARATTTRAPRRVQRAEQAEVLLASSSRPRPPARGRARRGRCCSRPSSSSSARRASGSAPTSSASRARACARSSSSALEVRLRRCGRARASACSSACIASSVGARERPERARVQVRDPLEHREERARLLGRHPTVTSTGAWSERTAPSTTRRSSGQAVERRRVEAADEHVVDPGAERRPAGAARAGAPRAR